ncbi:hypothetical protein ES702_00315 [subsurface metagenome]
MLQCQMYSYSPIYLRTANRSLDSNAYIAGCTDPTYSDKACGNKGLYTDLQWASLVRCYVSTDTSVNEEEWASCDEPDQPVVTTHAGNCVCTASAHTAVFTDNPNLTNIGVLPDALGKTIGFGPGHTPASDMKPTSQSVSASVRSTNSPSSTSLASSASSIVSTSMATSTSSRKSSTSKATTTSSPGNVSNAQATDSASPTSSDTPAFQGLSTVAEAGIGVGVGLGVLLACAILFLLYRRRLKNKYQLRAQHLSAGNEPSRTESVRSPAWSGYKSELPAGEQRSELPGSTHHGSLASKPGVSELEGASIFARMYNEVKSYTSSSASGRADSHSGKSPHQHSQPTTSTRVATIHELPGS